MFLSINKQFSIYKIYNSKILVDSFVTPVNLPKLAVKCQFIDKCHIIETRSSYLGFLRNYK